MRGRKKAGFLESARVGATLVTPRLGEIRDPASTQRDEPARDRTLRYGSGRQRVKRRENDFRDARASNDPDEAVTRRQIPFSRRGETLPRRASERANERPAV